MIVIAVIAADLAAIRPAFPLQISIFWTSYPWSILRENLPPNFPNFGLVAMILLLEMGLFRAASRRGVERAFWLGFEVSGWACVVTSSAFARPIWRQARSIFEGDFIGRQISRPLDMGRFVLFAGGLHLLATLSIAMLGGLLARSVWRRGGATTLVEESSLDGSNFVGRSNHF